MSRCPLVHEHPEFTKSYQPQKKQQKYQVEKLKKFLKSNGGDAVGERLKYELIPFKSFPRKNVDIRCLFVLCKDCQGKLLKNKCSFCGQAGHTMSDAVLFFIGGHKTAYGTEGRKIIRKYKK